MIIHAGFLVYVAVGGFLAWRPQWRWTIWPHLAAAAYGLGIVVVGWDCPLTHLENWARLRAGEEQLPPSGFIDHYVTGVIYPADHLLTAQLAVAATVLVSWSGAAILHRHRTREPSRTSRNLSTKRGRWLE